MDLKMKFLLIIVCLSLANGALILDEKERNILRIPGTTCSSKSGSGDDCYKLIDGNQKTLLSLSTLGDPMNHVTSITFTLPSICRATKFNLQSTATAESRLTDFALQFDNGAKMAFKYSDVNRPQNNRAGRNISLPATQQFKSITITAFHGKRRDEVTGQERVARSSTAAELAVFGFCGISNGAWSDWTAAAGGCNYFASNCGFGSLFHERACSNPPPTKYGACAGDAVKENVCYLKCDDDESGVAGVAASKEYLEAKLLKKDVEQSTEDDDADAHAQNEVEKVIVKRSASKRKVKPVIKHKHKMKEQKQKYKFAKNEEGRHSRRISAKKEHTYISTHSLAFIITFAVLFALVGLGALFSYIQLRSKLKKIKTSGERAKLLKPAKPK